MSDHPHTYALGHRILLGHHIERVCDRCALTESQSSDCPVAMREEIAALRGQVEDLKKERPAAVAFLRQWRDTLTGHTCRRQFTRAATDVENGAHRA